MSRQRRSPARCQEFEPVVQQCRDLRWAEHHRARRGKLDRERNAVQPPANGGDRAEIFLVVLEIRTQRLRPGHEQLDRGVLEHGFRCQPRFGRHAQRRNAIDMFAIDAQRFAAGRENGRAGAAADDRLGQVWPRHRRRARNCRGRAAGAGLRSRARSIPAEISSPSSLMPSTPATAEGTSPAFESEASSTSSLSASKPDRRRSGTLQRQRCLADTAGADQADDPIG